MDVSICNELNYEQVSLRSEIFNPGNCLEIADDNNVIVGKNRRDSINSFTALSAVHLDFDKTDGSVRAEQLVALQVQMKNREHFLCPGKPKKIQETLKLRAKKVKASKVFDKKDSEIEGKYRKYWFRLKQSGTGCFVYESLAYTAFFISVEKTKVLMRKCSEKIPTCRNFHIDMMPAFKKKYEVEVRSTRETFTACREIPRIEVSEVTFEETEFVLKENGGLTFDSTSAATEHELTRVKFEETKVVFRVDENGGKSSAIEELEVERQCRDETDDSADTPSGSEEKSRGFSTKLDVHSPTQSDERQDDRRAEMSSAGDDIENIQNYRTEEIIMTSINSEFLSDEDSKPDDSRIKMNGTGNQDTTSVITSAANGNKIILNGHGTSKKPIPLTTTRSTKRSSFLLDLLSCVSPNSISAD